MKTIDGDRGSLGDFNGNGLLVVNVASNYRVTFPLFSNAELRALVERSR